MLRLMYRREVMLRGDRHFSFLLSRTLMAFRIPCKRSLNVLSLLLFDQSLQQAKTYRFGCYRRIFGSSRTLRIPSNAVQRSEVIRFAVIDPIDSYSSIKKIVTRPLRFSHEKIVDVSTSHIHDHV